MKKIIEYKVVCLNEERLINKMLSEGWQPYGNPFFNRTYNCEMQAMVKYEEEEDKTCDGRHNYNKDGICTECNHIMYG